MRTRAIAAGLLIALYLALSSSLSVPEIAAAVVAIVAIALALWRRQ